jgi:hypothetical protein
MMDAENRVTGKRGPGRPPLAPGARLRTAGIRLSGEDISTLDRYCKRRGIKRTEAIRRFIDLIRLD